MSNNPPRAYLAGPIKGCTYNGATDWRQKVKDCLADVGIIGISPMRAKNYLKGEAKVGQDEIALKDSYDQFPLSTNKAILSRDYNDCTRSDAVIINFLGAEKVSIGTVMEAAWAHAARVPVIVVIEPDKSNVHEHGLLLEVCNFRVATLEDAVAVAAAILLP
jgi:nucleoside 2-deoxyribosyltransferase